MRPFLHVRYHKTTPVEAYQGQDREVTSIDPLSHHIYPSLREDLARSGPAHHSPLQALSDPKFLHLPRRHTRFPLSRHLLPILLDVILPPTFATYKAGRTTPHHSHLASPLRHIPRRPREARQLSAKTSGFATASAPTHSPALLKAETRVLDPAPRHSRTATPPTTSTAGPGAHPEIKAHRAFSETTTPDPLPEGAAWHIS